MKVTQVLWLLSVVASSSSSSQGLPIVLDITRLEAAGQPGCDADLAVLRQGLDTGQLWAQTMWDAGVKAPVGLLSQTAVQFGDFDECLSIHGPVTPQFCLMDVAPTHANSTWQSPNKWGLCLPASCSAQQLTHSLQNYMDQTPGQGVVVGVDPAGCTTRLTSSRSLTMADIVYSAVLVVILVVVSTATVYDMRQNPDYDGISPPMTLIQCLSARHGLHSLFRLEQPVPGINLSPMYGLHTLGFLFILLGHRFVSFHLFMTLTNYRSVEWMYHGSWFSIWACHMDLFVDLFFYMTAFLLSLMYYSELHKRFVSPLLVYFNRLCRILPTYAVVVFFYATLLRQLGDGPLWNIIMDVEQGTCRTYWWTNLLFINTYLHTDQLCIFQSWYISCDFQLFLMSTPLVLLLQQRPRAGAVVTVLMFLLSTLAPFLGTYLYDRPAMMLFKRDFLLNPRQNDMFTSVYSQAHYRGTSYLPGLLTGIYVYRHRQQPLTESQTYCLQVLGIVLVLCTNWSGAIFYNTSITTSSLVNALYAAFFHLVLGLGLSLFVVSCTLGKQTSFSRLLSWKGFVPLSKLSYCVFLLHFMVQFVWLASSRTASYLNPLTLISWVIADVVINLMLALVMFLTVETPVRYLVKFLVTGTRPPTSVSQDKLDEPKEVFVIPGRVEFSPSPQDKMGYCKEA